MYFYTGENRNQTPGSSSTVQFRQRPTSSCDRRRGRRSSAKGHSPLLRLRVSQCRLRCCHSRLICRGWCICPFTKVSGVILQRGSVTFLNNKNFLNSHFLFSMVDNC